MARSFRKLSNAAIGKLARGQRLTEHGITAEKMANGDVRFSVNVMVDRQRIHRVIGTKSEGVTRTQAVEFIEHARTKAREGRLDLPKGRKVRMVFEEAAEKYLERLEQSNGKNITNKRRHLVQNLIPAFGSRPLEAVKPFAIQHYSRDRMQEVKAPTVNRELATLSHLFSKAVEWEWIRPDQRPKITKLDEPDDYNRRILTEPEETALLRAAMESSNQMLWLYVLIGLQTSMRPGEIFALRYNKIDFERRRIFVPLAKNKERTQPITSEVAAALARQQKMAGNPDGWVFPSATARCGHITTVKKPFRKAVVAAKLNPKEIKPYTLRHTAITKLIERGVDLPTVQKVSGHRRIDMVLRYAHIRDGHIDDAIATLEKGSITQELHELRDAAGNR